ncbi:acetoacetate--CoA ligase [Epilithonimonas hungarica]|uniref:Acetoacetyl-CoA synthetase n=1 Tax=Epilithonimonas hungarica TaxID=454006 RepID=A0A1G7SB81_9FLAO|nr:acetoacetate--CoA ligase [Epilithonimonas hungarica]SDG20307.1 acetoacetyl-CoA synthetase [Epilithonimonas hungarica]
MSLNRENNILWEATESFNNGSEMARFIDWLKSEKQLIFNDYESLWQWSVDSNDQFWLSLWEFYEVIYEGVIEQVVTTDSMPGANWFTGTILNYAEHIFRNAADTRPALIYSDEAGEIHEMSWRELKSKVATLQHFLLKEGVQEGDRVAAFLCNTPEATIAMLATVSIGAVWSMCSPDFGTHSVLDRFNQIEPTVLIATTGYSYNGRNYNKSEAVTEIAQQLPSLKHLLLTGQDNTIAPQSFSIPVSVWEEVVNTEHDCVLHFKRVPFSSPLWVLYSSGTTGIPKAITQSHGGILLEHFKFLGLHGNVQPGDRYFWYSTTGWVMWNILQSSMLLGATAVLYEGSVSYPSMSKLWDLAESVQLTTFGVSASYIHSCMKKGISPKETHDLSSLKCIGSTGSVLSLSGAQWIYEHVKKDVWLASVSGGTDICSGFVAGNPMLPVYANALQCKALGCGLYAYDENGIPVMNEQGEMVITKPMPSMPIYFWGEKDGKRYHESYFDTYPGVWRHGDNIIIYENGSVEITGRSDATLNRMGVRIGTSEIYQSVEKNPEIKDSLVVNIELENGGFYMPLFVVLNDKSALTEDLKTKIKKALRSEYSPRHVPDEIIEVKEIPYTLSGKKMEIPVKRILKGDAIDKVSSRDAMKNPDSLIVFQQLHNKDHQ